MSTKVLVIGWDSADKDLLLQWSESGDLPNIQTLRNKGRWGILSSPPGMGDEAVWATFYTGVSPARHGRFFGKQVWPGSYDLLRFKDSHLKHEPFWDVLSRANKKVAILDVPKCPLSKGLNGIQLVDWMVHGAEHREVCSWPSGFASDVVKKFGEGPKCLCGYRIRSPSEIENFLDRVHTGIKRKTHLYVSLLQQNDWDLFLGVFKASHCVGHMWWHLWDSDHPYYREDLVRTWGNPIKDIYRALDASLGQILAQAGNETVVLMFSDLGMGPNYTGNLLLPEALKRLQGFSKNSGKAGLAWVRRVWKRLPTGVRTPLSSTLAPVNRRVANLEESLSRFFVVPHNEISGAVRINLKGREPNGCIQPGDEYEDLCQTLSLELRQLVCPETKKPLVRHVIRPREIDDGPYMENFPDLLVIWNRSQPIHQAWSRNLGTIGGETFEFRPGNHIPDGIVFSSGPAISHGAAIEPVPLLDLPATITQLLGVPLPARGGQPIPEFLQYMHLGGQ